MYILFESGTYSPSNPLVFIAHPFISRLKYTSFAIIRSLKSCCDSRKDSAASALNMSASTVQRLILGALAANIGLTGK
jgi:hypothetical protein